MKKYKVAIGLSVYNPNLDYLKNQVDSLLAQDYVIDLYIRDDGSTKHDHFDYLNSLLSHSKNVYVFYCENAGVFHSFINLLASMQSKGTYDLIGFSDQDDMALPNKVTSAVNSICSYDERIPLLYFSQMAYTDGDLNKCGVPYINVSKLGLSNAIVESSVNGNLIFMNSCACELVLRHIPSNFSMHDWWCYLCVSAFGKVVFDNTVTLLYRQHEGNVVGGSSSILSIFVARIRRIIKAKKSKYPIYAQAEEFYRLYKDDAMPTASRLILEKLINSKRSFADRIKYAMSTNSFCRMRIVDQFILRLVITLNIY